MNMLPGLYSAPCLEELRYCQSQKVTFLSVQLLSVSNWNGYFSPFCSCFKLKIDVPFLSFHFACKCAMYILRIRFMHMQVKRYLQDLHA